MSGVKVGVFSVYDSKAEGFLAPFYAANNGVAQRIFTNAVRSEGHDFFKFPEDYTLFRIGEFDSFNGEVQMCIREAICTGVQCVAKEA